MIRDASALSFRERSIFAAAATVSEGYGQIFWWRLTDLKNLMPMKSHLQRNGNSMVPIAKRKWCSGFSAGLVVTRLQGDLARLCANLGA